MNSNNFSIETIAKSEFCNDYTSEMVEKSKNCRKFKWISPTFYVTIIILFFMPFTELRCSGKTIVEIKGIELIRGKKLEVSHIKPNFFAIISFGCAIISLLLLVLVKKKRNFIFILSLVGFVSFFFLYYSINKNIGKFCVDIRFTNYFWAVFLIYFASCLYEAIVLRKTKNV